jgi:hypothetical protein
VTCGGTRVNGEAECGAVDIFEGAATREIAAVEMAMERMSGM